MLREPRYNWLGPKKEEAEEPVVLETPEAPVEISGLELQKAQTRREKFKQSMEKLFEEEDSRVEESMRFYERTNQALQEIQEIYQEIVVELKEKCAYYREVTQSNDYYPYECVVWIYGKGPDGKRLSYETIAEELGITRNKAHESKWIGLLLIGYRAADHPVRTRIKAKEIEEIWQKRLDNDKLEAQKKLKSKVLEMPKQKEILFREDEILEDNFKHEEMLKKEIAELASIIIPKRAELEKWEAELQKYQKAVQIIQKIRKKLIKASD